jgi:putative alpha-1,2-mannosidase
LCCSPVRAGFNHWAPQTTPQSSRSSSWWFSGNHHTLNWLRCTHQPSPWIGDWGWFLFMPIIGAHTDNPTYFWEPRGAVLKPHLFDATLAPSGVRVELVPTMHAASLRVTFPENSHTQEKRVCFREGAWRAQGSTLTGVASQVNKDGMQFDNFGLHIHAMSVGPATTEMKSRSGCFKFKNSDMTAEIRIATSLISQEQAKSNLEQEMAPGKVSFEAIKQETRAVWNKYLRRIDVLDPGVGAVQAGQRPEINKVSEVEERSCSVCAAVPLKPCFACNVHLHEAEYF